MLVDLRTAGETFEVAFDVCVIGAGAAGISLTRQLMDAGSTVCLIESGGLDFDSATQRLYQGNNLGMPYYDLVDARLRFFGGSTNIWGGRCTPLDVLDFERRDWVGHSGWPISWETLRPHYAAAHQRLELGEFSYDEALWAQLGIPRPELDPARMHTRFWRFDTVKERFGASRCADLFASPDVTVLLHANLTHLQANSNASALDCITVGTLHGKRYQLRAQTYVLACGGIENARMLLASNDVERCGIGNRYDQVGRFFMEHQHGRAGEVLTPDPHRLWNWFRKRAIPGSGVPVAPMLLPSPEAQERNGILNSALTFKLQRDPNRGLALNDRIYRKLKDQLPPDRKRRRLWHTYKDIRGWLQRHVKPSVERVRSRAGLRNLYLMIRAEQSPNPGSRVVLSQEIDALGVPRADLHWHLSVQDKATIRALCDGCEVEFQRLGLGRVRAAEWLADPSPQWPSDPTVSKHPIGGYHHMGTTRMSGSPRRGVVDENCRVHGYGNLYVAGSSVFTTGGWANPTLTILALTHRLGTHLQSRSNDLT